VPEEQKPRRRQARGERRVAQLLEAAADVFCKVGYTAATTNAIAREAGVSPGTLYQFFPNKEAIAIELGGILNQRMREGHGELFTPENATLPLREMLDVIVDPMIEFNCRNPAFLALVHDSDIPGTVVMEHDALHSTLLERVETLLGLRAPAMSASERARVAAMALGLFKAGLALVLAHQGEGRDAYIGEVKAALYGYLAPHVGTGAVTMADAPSAS
jgi:AcrR family transcriptional regulator